VTGGVFGCPGRCSWPPAGRFVIGEVPTVAPLPASTGPAVGSLKPGARIPVAAPAPRVGVRPGTPAIGPPEAPDGPPSVIASDVCDTYAGTIAGWLVLDGPTRCGSCSRWPVARAQRNADAATPAPSRPRFAPKRIRPPTKGQITTVSDRSQSSIHQALTESRGSVAGGRGNAPEATLDSARKGRADNFSTELCGGGGDHGRAST
jgi:hypothetical protein